MSQDQSQGGIPSDLVQAPGPQFVCLADFVREFIARSCARRVDGRTRVWSARWWDSPEAVLRLGGLWEAWEELKDVPGGASLWFRDHADYHLGVLFSPDGPFEANPDLRESISRRGDDLPCAPPPPGHEVSRRR